MKTIREDFPIFSQRSEKPFVYFDNAATTQKPRAVLSTISHFYMTYNASINRGLYKIAERATEAYENVRYADYGSVGGDAGGFDAGQDSGDDGSDGGSDGGGGGDGGESAAVSGLPLDDDAADPGSAPDAAGQRLPAAARTDAARAGRARALRRRPR